MKGLAAAVVVASGVTFGLFFVMNLLVAHKDVELEDEKTFRFIDVVENIEEQPPRRMERKVEKPPEVEAPPPELDTPQVDIAGPDKLSLNIGRAAGAGGVDLQGIDLGPSSDGDYLPLVRVQPQYPRRANERGVEGYVVVELTVAEDGTVPPDSIVIIEAEPKGYFERAAIRAAQKFKYKPKVVNGKPQRVTGVMYRFTFELQE